MAKKSIEIEIEESDEAGNLTATYVQSASDNEGLSRVDVIVSSHSNIVLVVSILEKVACKTNLARSYQMSASRYGRKRSMSFYLQATHIV